jgi:hypothetical protein
LSQSSADLIEELQLTFRSAVQQTDWDVQVVAGVGNRDVYLAGRKQHPWKRGIA